MTNSRFTTPAEFAAFKADVRKKYQPLGSVDKRLDEALAVVVQNTYDFDHGAASCERFLFVTGPSGSGKTYTLKRKFAATAEFQPYTKQSGKRVTPFISYRAPKQFSPREMLRKIAQSLKIPSSGSENHLRDMLDEQIPFFGLKYIHIDEAQHGNRANTAKTVLAFQDALKAITSMDHWPLHIILSGMPTLDDFRLADGQIERRSNVVMFHALEDPDDLEIVKSVLNTVVVEHCGLKIDPDLDITDLAARLCAACNGAYGYIIEAVQNACFLAIDKGRTTITIEHFAHNYRQKSAAKKNKNIFTAPDPFWRHIKPAKPTAER